MITATELRECAMLLRRLATAGPGSNGIAMTYEEAAIAIEHHERQRTILEFRIAAALEALDSLVTSSPSIEKARKALRGEP